VAGGRGHFGCRYPDIAGVQSPPLRGGWPRWDGLAGAYQGETKAFPRGRAEPAPPGGLAKVRWPTGERPEMTREVVFSEGRGLRARGAGPHVRRDIPFPPHALTMARWPKGGNVGVGVVPSLRACGARPSGGANRQVGCLSGKAQR
jgi:hypothetical protein